MLSRTRLAQILLFLACVLDACALEPSEERKRREVADREYSRLEQASGMHAGYIEAPNGKAVPVSVQVSVRKNPTPTGEKPVLLVVLRAGLFGGVRITSSSALFDWGTKGLSATFSPNKNPGADAGDASDGGSARLEFRATVAGKDLVDSMLHGAHQGSHRLILKRTSEELYKTDQEFPLLLHFGNKPARVEKEHRALLILKTRKEPEAAPADADLPLFPGLDASLYFEGFAITPHVPSRILYDPLKATLELWFSNASLVKFTDVYVGVDEIETSVPTQMHGKISIGGRNVKDVVLNPAREGTVAQDLPPTAYLGTYQGAANTLKYKAVAYLHYKESTSKNTTDFSFINFPDLRLEVVVCLGNEPFQKSFYKLITFDFLNLKGLLARELTLSDSPLNITWSPDLSHMDGVFATTDAGEGETDRPRVHFTARPSRGFKGCAETL